MNNQINVIKIQKFNLSENPKATKLTPTPSSPWYTENLM